MSYFQPANIGLAPTEVLLQMSGLVHCRHMTARSSLGHPNITLGRRLSQDLSYYKER